MSTTIKLDGSAVAKLIELDPDFKLELQRAVIAEVTRKLFFNDVASSIQKLIEVSFKEHNDALIEAVNQDEAFKKQMSDKVSSYIQSIRSNTYGRPNQLKLAPELENLISVSVKTKIDDAVEARVGTVDRRVKDECKRIEDAVVERIGKLGGTIEHNWKVEALKVIKADVLSTINDLVKENQL